jgi:protein-tyrosine phosphatase
VGVATILARVSDVFGVVFVCTGNRFRSPLAAAIFREATAGLPVRVSSAGTLELGAMPALEEALEAGSRIGVDLTSHRSRGLIGLDLSAADLVVGFERHHLGAAVLDASAPRHRVFTLPEIVTLLERLPDPEPVDALERARRLVALAAESRGQETWRTTSELEDPIGLSRGKQRSIAEQVRELTERLSRALFRGTATPAA